MSYQYIGRTTDFKGKPLWELLGNLKNYGVGRIVIRNRFQRYPEPCYMKILKVAALPNPVNNIRPEFINTIEARKCVILVEKVFRGKKNPEFIKIAGATYKADYQLIPKDEEYKFLNNTTTRDEVILPKTMELTPLLKELALRNAKAKGLPIDKEPQMEVPYSFVGDKVYRLAKDGETPTYIPTIGLGKPANPQLYANIKTD